MRTRIGAASTLILMIALNCLADEPQVSSTAQMAVNILGAVNKQCRVSLPSDATILDAVASAGGISDWGSWKVTIIHKAGGGKSENTKVNLKQILDGTASNVTLIDGDTIDVPGKTLDVRY